MYFVNIVNGDDIKSAPFEDKNCAIRYFNHVCDRLFVYSIKAERVEICNENLVLFDFEV